jgi:cell division protease FtsH
MSARNRKKSVQSTVEPTTEVSPAPPKRPRLEDIFGMAKAKKWGLALARDIAAHKAGRLPWHKVDHGCVLHGPPGTGKTTFARILAETCGVPLIETSYPAWQRHRDGHLGSVHAAMHQLFGDAANRAPSIVFIDEIDGIPARDSGERHNRGWWDQIVNALIEGIDDIRKNEKRVIVIGACNHADRIDSALMRSGRLDRLIRVDLPTVDDLVGIIRYHLKTSLQGEDLRMVAAGAVGMTGADIEKLVRDAERHARNDNDRPIGVGDLVAALDEEVAKIPPDCLHRVAVHEAGHAAVAILLGISDNVTTSLIRRGQSTASTYIDTRIQAITRTLVEKRIAVALGGRAAEDAILGDVTAGAGGAEDSDLAIASDLAIRSVVQWGLSCSGDILYSPYTAAEQLLLYRPDRVQEVQTMLNTAYGVALDLVRTHRAGVLAIADALVGKRALLHGDIVELLGVPPGHAASAP